ncbi:MAG TPA: ParB N-terminal domain-containing protein [Methylomirabilota bacterium]|jgi:ParB family chromosome partitioning protein|nr:ParB N-terminal domain-containing protein [Methylomirabilota bacterium]
MAKWTVFPDGTEPPRAARQLAEQVEQDGGHVLSLYQEPLKEAWHLFALLPIDHVKATPYQRDLSKPHVKRLTEVMRKLGRFVDPIVAVSTGPGAYWTPNGNHRREAALKLKADYIPAILIPETEVSFQILALNTEKAHNVREKSLEVIRMYRGLIEQAGQATEEDYAFQFEAPYFITLGLLYEAKPRFAGGAFAPLLRRVDRFLKQPIKKAYAERERRAALVRAADEVLSDVVAKIKKRGINHPYVKNYVLARTTPLSRARKTLPSFDQTFERLQENLEKFDPAKVRLDEIARSAVFAAPAT